MLVLIILAALIGGISSNEASSDRSYLGLPTFYLNAIDALYKDENLPALAIQIHDTHQQAGELNSFTQMVKLQLYLLHKYNQLGDHNDGYVFNAAYYLYRIQGDSLKTQLADDIQEELQKSIDTLPSSLQYFLFKPSFCLLNQKFSEFIYTTTAIKIDAQRRHIFVWNDPNWVGTNGRWLRHITDESNENQLNVKFALQNDLTYMFLYRESQIKDMITAWQSGNKPDNADWSVQLYENRLIFTQDGHMMCTGEDTYSPARRYVYGYVINDYMGYNEMLPACQWYAKECPS